MKTKIIRNLILGIFCCGLILSLHSQTPEKKPEKLSRPGIGERVTLEDGGLRMRVFRKCRFTPIPFYSVYYADTDKDRKNKLVESGEYWRYKQTHACFISDEEISIRIFRPELPAENIPDGYVMLDDFDNWIRQKRLKDGDAPEMTSWLKMLSGTELKEADLEIGKKDFKYAVYEAESQMGRFLFYLSVENTDGRRFVIEYKFPPYDENDAKAMRKALTASIKSFQFLKVRASQKEDDAPVEIKPERTLKKTIRKAQEASRKRVIASLKNAPGWWYHETEHFVFISDLRKHKNIHFIQEEAEKVYNAYVDLIPTTAAVTSVPVIRIFERKSDYLAYSGMEKWSAGCWMASRQELVFYLDSKMSADEQEYQKKAVLHHELFHQYLHHTTNGAEAQAWFNEGSATYFEKIDYQKREDTYSMAITRDNLEQARKVLFSPYADVRKLLNLSYQEFYADKDRTYRAAFALMCYIYKGFTTHKDRMISARYAAIPAIYLDKLTTTGDPAAACAAAWAGIDMDRFNQDFKEFWSNKAKYNKLRDRHVLGTHFKQELRY